MGVLRGGITADDAGVVVASKANAAVCRFREDNYNTTYRRRSAAVGRWQPFRNSACCLPATVVLTVGNCSRAAHRVPQAREYPVEVTANLFARIDQPATIARRRSFGPPAGGIFIVIVS